MCRESVCLHLLGASGATALGSSPCTHNHATDNYSTIPFTSMLFHVVMDVVMSGGKNVAWDSGQLYSAAPISSSGHLVTDTGHEGR